MVRWRKACVVATVATLVIAGCSTGGGDGATTESTTAESAALPREWLFSLQSGGTAVFDQSSGVLSVPVGNLVGFTDRPYRDVRAWTPTDFAALWTDSGDDSFSADPPNASLTYWEGDGPDAIARTVICEITGEVTYDGAGNALSMALRILSPTGADLPATLYRASLFIDSLSTPCQPSPDDEMIVEYFNEMNFNEMFVVDATQMADGASQFLLTCPERESPDIPPAAFDLSLTDPTGAKRSTCDSTSPVVLDQGDPACSSDGFCRLLMTLTNAETGAVYSQTELVLRATDGDIIPQLNPATIPICASSFSDVLSDPFWISNGGNGGNGGNG